MDYRKLMLIANQVRQNAYAPYSGFSVGCALLTASGKVYTGVNVENVSFSAGCCAERVALYKAVSEGERDFVALAVCGGKVNEIEPVCSPCGVCRQTLSEFCKSDFIILLGTPDNFRPYTLSDLLPFNFNADLKVEK